MSTKLTKRQAEILDLIYQSINNAGRPPTRAEISKTLGFKSANAAEDHLRALQRKGYIQIQANTSRGIQLTELGQNHYGVQAESTTNTSTQWLADALRSLPLIGRVAAGSPILAAEHVEKEIPVSLDMFDAKPDYLLRVRGNSMCEIGILDGDLLAVKSTPDARNGEIIIARIGDDVTVKRLQKTGNNIQLLPENHEYRPIKINPGDDFHIEGIAVGLLRTGKLN